MTQLTRRIGGIPVPPLLLGDAAYPLSKTLLKPHPENALAGAAERRFSTRQCRTRVKVEQSYGELQGRWRCLSKRLDESPPKAAKTFIACCVLHNICVDMGDRLDNPPIVRGPPAVPPPPPPLFRGNDEGKRVRNAMRFFLTKCFVDFSKFCFFLFVLFSICTPSSFKKCQHKIILQVF